MSMKKAALFERAEMYNELADEMQKIARASDCEWGKTEQRMLSNAYKHIISKMRASWRSILAIVEKLPKDDPKKALASKYLGKIIKELQSKCKELLKLIEENLIPKLSKPESKVFFLKMKGDHLRYLVEIADSADENLKELKEKSKMAYNEAVSISEECLNTTHPFRLGLALNFSVFYYEVENSKERAYEMAKKAFDEAMPLLDRVQEDEADDVTTIMQLLRDNLTFWSEDV